MEDELAHAARVVISQADSAWWGATLSPPSPKRRPKSGILGG